MRHPRRPSPNQPYYVDARKRDRVWAYLTQHPGATIRTITQTTGLSHSTVATCIRVLVQAGYIECPPRTNDRRIIVPLYALGQDAQLVKRDTSKPNS